MPSIFTRARTTSSKNLPKPPTDVHSPSSPSGGFAGIIDEFGRVRSRGAGGAVSPSKDSAARTHFQLPNTSTATQARKDVRSRADSSFDTDYGGSPAMQEGFLPSGLAVSSAESGEDAVEHQQQQQGGPRQHPQTHQQQGQQMYGYLGYANNVVLGVEDVTRLVDGVADELGRRGLTTPFLFSNTALDISTANIRRLINAFLYSVNPALVPSKAGASASFNEEATFAGPHDLGMVLRWGLARIVRVTQGVETRGLFGWETYLEWRRIERESNYDKSAFTVFLSFLAPQVRTLTVSLFMLLSRLLANSTSNGLTPSALATLFGPLVFGLGLPSSVTSSQTSTSTGGTLPDDFHATYTAYLRGANGTEHLLLAFVRAQIHEHHGPNSPSPPPRRLVTWVAGYPHALPPLEEYERQRKGMKCVRALSVRRNTRMYDADLVRSAVGWMAGPAGVGVRGSREWGRVCPEVRRGGVSVGSPGSGDRMDARYSDGYRKRMDLPPTFFPQVSTIPVSSSALSTPSSSTSSSASGTTNSTKASSFLEEFELGLGGLGLGGMGGKGVGGSEESKFRSLTDMRWGQFENAGFGDGYEEKLKFDLNESARTERNTKRTTLTWADFSAAGFSRSDASLSATLQFSSPVTTTIQQWPDASKDLHRKLKKQAQQAKLPAFGWDTSPVMDGREVVVEEGFVDVFCDLVYGGGWMERGERRFRECSWALVEFKSMPTNGEQAVQAQALLRSVTDPKNPSPDPRSAATLILFEEFVPAEYRHALVQHGNKPRTRLPSIPSILSPGKKSGGKWKQAATLNGKPYTIGAVPRIGAGGVGGGGVGYSTVSGAGVGAGGRIGGGTREEEFERLLMGGGAVTKVITLDGAARASSATPTQGLSLNTAGPASLSTPNVNATASPSQSAPLPPAPSLPLPSSSAAKSAEQSPSSPAVGGTPIKKSRFRFPVGRETRHMVPSEYDTVDFETRLASYSDDESNGGAGGKGRQGKEKDDAWVDILVASNAKRMTNQDAEMKPRGRNNTSNGGGAGLSASQNGGARGRSTSGHSDPERAHAEVELALAEARAMQMSPHTDDEDAEVGRMRRELAREVEVREVTPEMLQSRSRERSVSPQPPAGDDEEEYPSVLRDIQQKRRVGYFDMHPDRRPGTSGSGAPPAGYGHDDRDTMYSEGDFEPAHSYDPSFAGSAERLPDGDIEVPAFVDVSPSPGYGNTKKDSMTLPAGTTTSASRTAQLIEMYREREKQAGSSPSPVRALPATPAGIPGLAADAEIPTTAPLMFQPKPSRLPVRSSSLQQSDSSGSAYSSASQALVSLIPGAGPPSSIPMPTSKFDHDDDEEEVDEERLMHELSTPAPASFATDDIGRASPMRYVHGAPLHNVIEEGEEEE